MNQLSEHQQVLLKVYKRFDEFCQEHQLTFYAAYGTMIGAIRHQGFIPWDDDIDVFMLRKDYDRFVELRSELKDPSYKISIFLDGESPYPFAKFYTTEGTIWEYSQFPFIIGPWIDVFPIDEGEMDDKHSNKVLERFHNVMWKYRKALAYASWREIAGDFFNFRFMEGSIKLVKKVRYAPFKRRYISQMESVVDDIRAIKGRTLRCYSTALTNEVFEKEWFKEAVRVPFEDATMSVPSGYHDFLTALYGDYLQLPPVAKRVNHPAYFSDLEHTLTREEILKEHKDILVYKSMMSFKVLWDELIHRSKGWPRPRPKKKSN